MKKIILIIIVVGIVIAGGFTVYQFLNARVPQPVSTAPQVNALVSPRLTYDNAYNGPIYTTSEKLGDDFPSTTYFSNLERNGIPYSIIYFNVESSGDITTIRNTVAQYPGRVVPFISTGLGAQSEASLVGDELTEMLTDSLATAQEKLGDNKVKGLGEIEIHVWDMPHTDSRILQLFTLAQTNNLAVMIHPRPGEAQALGTIAESYPNTIFLIHLFRPDFERDREQIIALMQEHANIIYTIDADHLLFDTSSKIGLLYKYQDASVNEGKQGFIQDFDRLSSTMLQSAIATYKPLIDAVPNQVTIGTEMSNDYTFEPDVYDRIIKLQRQFLGQLDPTVQEPIAYKNALRIFGEGVTLR